jgi:hypothetical protein
MSYVRNGDDDENDYKSHQIAFIYTVVLYVIISSYLKLFHVDHHLSFVDMDIPLTD